MRWLGLIGCVLFLAAGAQAQQTQFAYRVVFPDKQGAPAQSLSTRALQRRAAQGIALDSTDRPVVPRYLDSVLARTGGVLHNTSRWLNQCVVLLTDSSRIHQLDNKPYVVSTAYVGYFPFGLHNRPSGASAADSASRLPAGPPLRTTGSPAFYNRSYNQVAMVAGDCLHDQGFWGEGKLIAVLDAGFAEADVHHGFDTLRQRGGIVDTYNFRANNTQVYQYDIHGTASLSAMAGYLPGTYVGSAPKAIYALYVTDDNAYTDALYELDNFIAGMERADSIGADVISSSLGYNEFTSPYPYLFPKTDLDGHTTIVSKGLNMAVAKGMFVVTSAGNEGGNFWNFLLTPGDADSALTVGAVLPNKTPASFSGPGPNAAGKIKPDVCALGDPAAVFSFGQSIINSSGTSWSTPQISGFVACLWQSAGNLKPYAIRQAIIASADHFTTPGPQIGYGVPDFCKARQSLDSTPPKELRTIAVTVGPNPFRDELLIRLALKEPGDVHVELVDAVGRNLFSRDVHVASGNQDVRLPVPASLPAGAYFLRTTIGGSTQSNKLIKE